MSDFEDDAMSVHGNDKLGILEEELDYEASTPHDGDDGTLARIKLEFEILHLAVCMTPHEYFYVEPHAGFRVRTGEV